MSDPCSHLPIWAQDAADLLYVPIIAAVVFAVCAGFAIARKWKRRDSRPPLEAAIHKQFQRKEQDR